MGICCPRGGLTATDKVIWAGTETDSELGEYAWFKTNSDNKTHEVKKKKPNGYGLYDMSGNVNEWCWDRYNSAQYTTDQAGVTNPQGDVSAPNRVFRGGSWNSDKGNCRMSRRNFYSAGVRNQNLGFRLVRSVR